MHLLLDTHAYLWFIAGDDQLSPKAKAAIENPENLKLISAASLWEITIKLSLGKLALKTTLERIVSDHIFNNGFNLLQIETGHLIELSRLPMHHRDPFDRLLVAQCKADGLALCSADQTFENYDIQLIW
jgi:PIN domain nuclease of toxin-antitoxin system